MSTEVLTHVSGFLDAIPSQVKRWDGRVLDYLTRNSGVFHEFKAGNDTIKWDIYASIRYRRERLHLSLG